MNVRDISPTAVSTLMIDASSPQIILAITIIIKLASLITGAKLSSKSKPGSWLYPHTTILALKIPILLILKINLHLIVLLPLGISSF
jgi:hypothetical protein